jgi:hypothetical protein
MFVMFPVETFYILWASHGSVKVYRSLYYDAVSGKTLPLNRALER